MKIPNQCDSILVSIVVSIPACHAGDRGSIPRRGGFLYDLIFNHLIQDSDLLA